MNHTGVVFTTRPLQAFTNAEFGADMITDFTWKRENLGFFTAEDAEGAEENRENKREAAD